MEKEIIKKILSEVRDLESKQNIKILFAIESGSRLWRIESKDSDYDIRFVFIRDIKDYLRINKLNEVIELRRDNRDYVGFDIYKFCRLILNSNPSVIEWLQSDIIYYDNGKTKQFLYNFIKNKFNPVSLFHHYKSMCKTNYSKYIKTGNLMSYKKYLYSLRGLINAKYVLDIKKLPEIDFNKTIPKVNLPNNVRGKLEKVLMLKKESREKDITNGFKIFDDYIGRFLKEEYKIETRKIIDYKEIQNYIISLLKFKK